MCFDQREIAVHPDVDFDGVIVADAAGTEIVRILHVREGRDDAEDFLFHVIRQRGFGQVVDAVFQQFPGGVDDEEADDQRGQRVEDRPAVAEQDGAADAHERADGGERVAAMMPGVGFHDG